MLPNDTQQGAAMNQQMQQQTAQPVFQAQQQQQQQQQQQGAYYAQEYIHKDDYAEDRRNALMKKTKLQSVRDAVEQVMPNAYHMIDQVRAEENESQRHTKLHHSRGTQLTSGPQGKVLEFDIAGSSFKQFRTEHLGFKGKGSSAKDYMKYKESRLAKILEWIPGGSLVNRIIRSNSKKKAELKAKSNLRKLNAGAISEDMLSEDALHNVEVLKKWNSRIGDSQSVTIGGKTKKHKHIRKVIKGNKTRITMAGPLSMKGMRNAGEYSIENLREYMLAMGQDYLRNIMRGWASDPTAQPHDIWLKIRGHSRGGVASVEGAMMIKQWLHENYPQYEDRVKFDLTQYDPVPGFGSNSGTHQKVDVKNDTQAQQNKKMRALGDSAQTTVVYSMHTEHSLFFTPQQVANTNRIILTPYAHSVGLAEVDRQASSQQRDAHRVTFTDAATQEAYRLGSLNELPEGVYVLDENKTLVQLHDLSQWIAIRDSVLKNASGQEGRHEVITEAVSTWFHTHSAPAAAPAAGANG